MREKEILNFYKSESEEEDEDESISKGEENTNINTKTIEEETNVNNIETIDAETNPNSIEKVIEESNANKLENSEEQTADKTEQNEKQIRNTTEKDGEISAYNKINTENGDKSIAESETTKGNKMLTEDMDFDLHLSDDSSDAVSQSDKQKAIETAQKSIQDVMKELKVETNPRLSGAPDEEIDLDYGVVKPSNIAKLMDRYIKHTTQKKNKSNKLELE